MVGLLDVIVIARSVIVYIFDRDLPRVALNPAVDALQRRGVRVAWLAVWIVFIGAILAIAGVCHDSSRRSSTQVNDFVDAVPGYVDDLTEGQGRLGFLEREVPRSRSGCATRSPKAAERRRCSGSPAPRSRSPRA